MSPAQVTGTELSRRRITAAAAVQLASRAVSALLGAAVAAVLARALTPAEFGAFTLTVALMTLAENIGDFGVGQTASRDMARFPERRGSILGALIAVRMILACTMLVVTNVIVVLLIPQGDLRLMAFLILTTMLLGGINSYGNGAQARLRSEVAAVFVLAQSAAWLGSVFLLWHLNAAPWWYGVAYLASGLIQSAVTVLMSRRLIKPNLARWRTEVRRLYHGAWRLGVAGTFVSAYYKLDAILLFKIKGGTATAYYGAAYKVLDALTLAPGAMVAIMVPLLAAIERSDVDDRRLRRSVQLAIVLICALTFPVVTCGIPLSVKTMTLIFGARYHTAGQILEILICTFVPLGFSLLFSSILILRARLTPYIFIAFGGAVLNIAADLVLIPRYGARGAAWAALGTEILVAFSLWRAARQAVAIVLPVRQLVAAVAASVGAGLITAWTNSTVSYVAALLAGSLCYLALAFGLRAVTVRDLRQLLSRQMGAVG